MLNTLVRKKLVRKSPVVAVFISEEEFLMTQSSMSLFDAINLF